MEQTTNPWSVPVAVDNITETGLHLEIAATDAVRGAIAKLAGLRDLPEFTATFDLIRQGSGVHVAGLVNARVGQTCVVTLEPIESRVEETVAVVFAPSTAAAAQGNAEPPEPLVNGQVDLGALATEFLLLGIDPYPRKQGVEFAPPKADEGGDRPFNALEALKKRLGGGQS